MQRNEDAAPLETASLLPERPAVGHAGGTPWRTGGNAETDRKTEILGDRETGIQGYRGTSLIRNCFLPGPYSRTMPRALRWS